MDESRTARRSAPKSLAGWLNAQNVPSALTARRWTVAPAGPLLQCHFFFIAAGTAAVASHGPPATCAGPAIIWLPPATAGYVEYAAGASGGMFVADDTALRRTIEAGPDAMSLRRLWNGSLSVSGTRLTAIADELHVSLAALTREVQTPQRASSALGATHVTLLLLHLWRNAGAALTAVAPLDDRSVIIGRFLELVETHYLEHWTVARYARALAVPDDRLHAICMRVTGRGPLAHIHRRSIDEARKRLVRSALPIEAIAAELGFSDPGYFNRFFKRQVGESPGLFRRRAVAAMFEASSFASWP